jgi:hypothetical protein
MPVEEKISGVFNEDSPFLLYSVLFRTPQRKLLLGRSRKGCEKITEMNIKETM